MSSSRKRKQRTGSHSTQSHNQNMFAVPERDLSPGPGLYIQAYEADIIRGPAAALSARSLEVSETDSTMSSSSTIGNALIKWDIHQLGAQAAFPQDEDDFGAATNTSDMDSNAIWVDRYDARLLLDALPSLQPSIPPQPGPDSPGGWSDIPSDNEDIFFLSPEEAEDFRRDKKRRHIERVREERLQARRAEDGEPFEEEEVWGGSDEEPEEPQRDLMRRTATHILSSPNPAQLEMRILANHGSDRRFAFLRGRWSRAWQIVKGKARLEHEKEKKGEKGLGLGALAGYGDSDADSDDSDGASGETDAAEPPPEIPEVPLPPVPLHPEVEDAAKEARRARAKEWAERRRLLKEDTV
ncbi:hypothetical protein FPV67DRAFT_1421199 [Lyophyllum atratum]|nr:hypothetical protein FPV67DRAFT_1421199 [Lyophyllum atratum]